MTSLVDTADYSRFENNQQYRHSHSIKSVYEGKPISKQRSNNGERNASITGYNPSTLILILHRTNRSSTLIKETETHVIIRSLLLIFLLVGGSGLGSWGITSGSGGGGGGSGECLGVG